LDEMEGKWSVIQADDGKTPDKYTVSNMHLAMVAALDKSLRPRRQYNKTKKKPPSRGKRDMQVDHYPSEEDLFLDCLEKQLAEAEEV